MIKGSGVPGLFDTRRMSLAAVAILCLPIAFQVAANSSETPISDIDSSRVLSIHKNPKTLEIFGNTSSTAHEIILRRTVQRFFSGLVITIELSGNSAMPPGWALVTELVLRAIEKTDAARAKITATHITVEGVTIRPEEYALALQRVQSALIEGMSINSQVSTMSSSASFSELCQERFRITAASITVEFAVSTADFKENTVPLLDALIEIAVDCPDTKILVTGHTDQRGNRRANAALGLARANRVIEFMAGRGVPAGQLDAAVAAPYSGEAIDSTPISRQHDPSVDFEMIIL